MSKQSLFALLLTLLCAPVVALAQTDDIPIFDWEIDRTPKALEAFAQGAPSSHNMLVHRTALTPYPTREEALAGGTESSLVVELDKWQVDSLADGAVKYTTRFKRNYRHDDTQLILRVEGAGGAVSVEVNDSEVGYTSSGRGRSEFDLTKKLHENYNTISIVVHTSYRSRALEAGRKASPTFSRAVLLTSPRVAISDYTAATTFNHAGEGLLNLGVVMQSYLLNSKTYEVGYELIDDGGKILASATKELNTGMLSRDTVSFFARIPAVKKWDHKEPNLYTLVLFTRHERRPKEFTSVPIGFRTVEFSEEGKVVINGEAPLLHPVEAEWCGDAQTTEQHLRELRSRGYNTIYVPAMQPDEFYTLCDRIGLYVRDQADIDCTGADRTNTPSNNPEWKGLFSERIMEMYHSAKNHPSVVMFSLARNAQNGICLYESYLQMKSLKGESRPMIYPEAAGEWNSDL